MTEQEWEETTGFKITSKLPSTIRHSLLRAYQWRGGYDGSKEQLYAIARGRIKIRNLGEQGIAQLRKVLGLDDIIKVVTDSPFVIGKAFEPGYDVSNDIVGLDLGVAALECYDLGQDLKDRETLTATECRNLADMLNAAADFMEK